MRARTLLPVLGVMTVAVALLSGCSTSSTSTSSTSTPSATPKPTATVTTPATASPTPTPTSGADASAPTGQCADSALTTAVVADPSGAGAGSIYYDVRFTNTGTSSCVLAGFPGVSVVGDGNGTQLGAAAARPSSTTIAKVTLTPGATAYALLQATNIAAAGGALGSSCTVVTGDGWRVYAPHSYRAVYVADAGVPACSNGTVWLHLQGPVALGSHA